MKRKKSANIDGLLRKIKKRLLRERSHMIAAEICLVCMPRSGMEPFMLRGVAAAVTAKLRSRKSERPAHRKTENQMKNEKKKKRE
jgi:hypothetical protein